MKENDFFAVTLNTEGTGLSPDDLRGYGITPDNTGLKDKDYYKSIPRVQERFTNPNGEFDNDAFSAFYDSAKRTYSDFAQNAYVNDLIKSVPSSEQDIFSIGDTNLYDDSVKIVASRDPNRHQVGMGNIFQTGPAAFSEREVAQAYKALDEDGKELDWAPNDKGGLWKALFRPTLALATWDEDGYHTENGREVYHHKGEHKYDSLGNPRYQVVSGETYDKEVLHWGDTVTKEGSWLNKIDPFDFDSVKTSPGRVIYNSLVRLIPYLTPAAEVFGALEAAKALSKTLPVLGKMVNGMVSTNSNSFGQAMTSAENWAKRFDSSVSDAAQGNFFSFENIGQQLVDSAKQLYSQGLIQKIPQMLSKNPSLQSMKLASVLSTAYLATTSAEDVYGDYINAGASEGWAGIGALATMGAFYAFMRSNYFKEYLFNDPALELPELKKVVRNEVKTSLSALEQRIAANENITVNAVKKGLIPKWSGEKWYHKATNAVSGALNKVLPKVFDRDNTYLVRSFNEGLEEVMEEGATDLIKGLTLGAQSLGFTVKDRDASELNFGFSPEDFISRYSQAFLGGALGGAVFEGLQQWQNHVIHRDQKLISDLNLDDQLVWYIRNNRTNELLDIVDSFEKKGMFGSKNLSLNYTIEDGKIIWDATDDPNKSQNTQLANALRQRIRTLSSELTALNFVDSDNELLVKALQTVQKEAKAEGFKDVNEYREKRLRDERIDFIKQHQVDKLIISDIADLQHKIRVSHEQIEALKADMRKDDKHSLSDEEIAKNPAIKILQDNMDEDKKALDEILSGKRASEYLGLGLFAGDDELLNIYLAPKAEDGKRTYFTSNLKNYVRAKYAVDLDEMIEKSGGRDAEGKSKVEEYFRQEFEDTMHKETLPKIRAAYNLHKRLGSLLNPVIKKQIETYDGYKSDPDRHPEIELAFPEERIGEIKAEYQSSLDAINAYVNANPVIASRVKSADAIDLDALAREGEEEEKMVQRFKKAKSELDFLSDPRTALERIFKEDSSDKAEFFNLIGTDDPDKIIDFLKKYYTHLNKEKIVSEFSDDLFRIGIATSANRLHQNAMVNLTQIRETLKSHTKELPPQFGTWFESLANNPELDTIFIEVQLDNDSEPTLHSIREIFDLVHFAYSTGGLNSELKIDGEIKPLFEFLETIFNYDDGIIGKQLDDKSQAKLDAILESINTEAAELLRNISENAYNNVFEKTSGNITWFDVLDEIIELQKNQNQAVFNDETWASIRSRLTDVLSAFEKDPDYALELYESAVTMIKDLVNEGQLIIDIDPKDFVDSILFNFGNKQINLVDEVKQLKELRANMVHSPIIEWVRALSSEFGGVRQDLLDLLEKEQKGLISKDTLDDYIIENPFVKSELEYLENALTAATAILRGSRHLFGVNNFINALKDGDELPILSDGVLGDVYAGDLATLQQRVAVLNELNRRNKQGVVKMRQESFAVSAPKLFKTFLKKADPEESPEDNQFWIGKFQSVLGINIDSLWGDRFDLESVTVSNLPQFWSAVRGFLNELYDKVKELDWEKICAKQGKANANQVLAELLMDPVTNAWNLENSVIDNKPETQYSNLDVALFMAGMLTVDPRETFGKMKAASENLEGGKLKPFLDQMLAIAIGHCKRENKELYNAIGEIIVDSQNKKSESLGHQFGLYFKSRPLIYNALNIDGASGTGKSSVVLRFIHYMANTSEEKPLTIVCAKYGKRMAALRDILNAEESNCFTFSKLAEKFLGRPLTSDDFEDHTEPGESGHAMVLKKEVISKLKGNFGTDGVVDIYIDESGLFSEGELVFLSEISKLGNVNLIFAGDKMQNGATNSKGQTSGIGDCVILGTPRLTLSMRVGNLGMITNLTMLEEDLQEINKVYKDTPWIETKDAIIQLDGVLQPRKLKYSEKQDAIYGFRVVEDGDNILDKLKSFKSSGNGTKIAIITDQPDKYSSQASSDVEVISIEEVQGGEYDYVLADIRNIDESRPDNYYKKVYTIISRARTGGYIIGGLGSKFNTSESDPNASIIVNPTQDVDESNDMSLDKYGDWWINTLMKDEVWNGTKPTVTSGTTGSSTSGGGTPSTPGGKGPSGQNKFTGSGTKAPVLPQEFNLDEYKERILDENIKDEDIIDEFAYGASKQVIEDIKNYRKYHHELKNKSGSGRLLDLKSYIDWVIDGGADEYIFGSESYHVAAANTSDEGRKQIREAVRNLAIDLITLDSKALNEKYSRLTDSPIDNWGDNVSSEFKDALKEKVLNENGNLQLYAITDGNFSYMYYIVGQIAIPVARVEKGIYSGWVTLKVNKLSDLCALHTDGRVSIDPKDDRFTRYAQISNPFVSKLDPQKTVFTEDDLGRDNKRFAKHIRGIGQVVISPTFNTPVDPLLTPVKEGEAYKRLDSTYKSGSRFMAVSRRYNWDTYFHLAQLLNKLHHNNNLSDKEMDELVRNVGNYAGMVSSEPDKNERMQLLRRSDVLQYRTRDLLTTALMRFFMTQNKDVALKFFANLNSWVSSDEYITTNNDGEKISRQKGIKFSLSSKIGKSQDFYIVLNKEKSAYDIYFKQFNEDDEIVPQIFIEGLAVSDYFNFESQNPADVAKNLINEIRKRISDLTEIKDSDSDEQKAEKSRKLENFAGVIGFLNENISDDSDYSLLLKSGSLAFGLATKKQVNENTGFWVPFDSDIAELLDGVTINSTELETFLANDTIFKNNLIVGVRVDDGNKVNDVWLRASTNQSYEWDIAEIIPALYEISQANEIEDISSLPIVGQLGHKGSTDSKENILVTEVLNEQGEVSAYRFNKDFRISVSDLSEYVNTNHPALQGKSEVLIKTGNSIIKLTDGKYYLNIDGDKIEISNENIKKLISGMNVVASDNGIIATSSDWTLRRDDTGRIVLQNGDIVNSDIYIIKREKAGENASNVVVYSAGNIITFNKLDDSIINSAGLNYLVNNAEWLGDLYFYSDGKVIIVNPDNLLMPEELIPTMDGNRLLLGGREIELPSNVEQNLIKLLPKGKVSIRAGVKAREKFAGANVDFDDKLLENDPNTWALNNAVELNGLYEWTGSAWKQTEQKARVWAYANIVSEERGIDPVTVYKSLNGDVGEFSDGLFRIAGRVFRVERVGSTFKFSELNDVNTPEEITQFKNSLRTLSTIESIPEEVRNSAISLFQKLMEITGKVNSGSNDSALNSKLGEIYKQLRPMLKYPEINNVLSNFEDISDQLDDRTNCEII